MRRLLLVSSSRVHGSGYLEHCREQVARLFEGMRKILFVPYALGDLDGYARQAARGFEPLGLELQSIHKAADPAAVLMEAEGLFIGGGNTFRLLNSLYRHNLVGPIRERALGGMPYLGTSAGSNVACATIKTTNDMPIILPPTFDALSLVPFQLNPHYIDPDPSSQHMGETRETRIREFHEENDLPVLAIREGAMLEVGSDTATLLGSSGGRLFLKGQEPRECTAGQELGPDLLAGS